MEAQVTVNGEVATIAVSGSVNTNTAPQFEKAVEEAFSAGDVTSVTFDFSNLDYISSAGLRVLMVAYKRVMAAGGELAIEGSSDEVMEVFEITGIADLLNL